MTMYQRPGRIWIPEAPHLILNRTREIGISTPSIGFEGWFHMKLIDAASGRVKRELHFRNLIVDGALDYLGSISSPNACQQFAQMGTGGTAPTNADTGLQTPIGTRIFVNGPSVASGPAFAYWSSFRTFTFLEPNANGNLTEIGLFSAGTGGTMWTRQILKDGTGTPTTITKTSAEQLQVTYEMRVYSPTTDVSNNVTISSVVYAYTVRAADISDSTAWGAFMLANFFAGGAVTSFAYETDVLNTTAGHPGGAASACNSGAVTGAYVPGTFSREHTYIWEPTNGNFATGIGSMLYGGCGSSIGNPWQIKFTPKIPKDATKRLTLVVNNAWGRYP
jgi:hypothetical protein